MDKISENESNESNRPNRPLPSDFDIYLPWACQQLSLHVTVIVDKIMQSEYVSSNYTDRSKTRSKGKTIQSRTEINSDQAKEDSRFQKQYYGNIVRISAVFDTNDNLIQIRFDKNSQIPRAILKIISLIIKFQPYLTSFKITRGLDKYILYELCNCLNISNITEVCLDNTFVPEANYDLLLDKETPLRHLSLARCRIEDSVVENIALKLVHPLPGSKTLRTLNLSSNRLTDAGAYYLGNVLRSNRTLCYLNLADNYISDDGASSILNNLLEFPITYDEVMATRTRFMVFLRHKSELIQKFIAELKAGDFDKKSKRKPTRPTTASSGRKAKPEKESSLKSFAEADAKSMINIEMMYLEKAETMADDRLGEFGDPFNSASTFVKDGITYCYGNNTLCYLNLAYNDISFFTVKELLKVVSGQKLLDRRPRGLINVNIEGNNIPVTCKEHHDLDDLLEMGLMVHSRRISAVKKKLTGRTPK